METPLYSCQTDRSLMKLNSLFIALLLALASTTFGAEKAIHRYEAVFTEHIKTLQHLDQINPQLVVFISGAFGMGKTEVAKIIEKRCKAIRLNGDTMRELLAQAGFSHSEVNDYFSYCIHRLHEISNNRMFVVDRTYNDNQALYQSVVEDYGALKFTIRLEVPKELARQRVIARGKDVLFLLSHFDTSYDNHMLAAEREVFDYTIDNAGEGFSLDESLFEKIESKFRFHNPRYGTRAFHETRKAIVDYAESGKPVLFPSHFSTILPGLYVGNQKSVLAILSDERARITSVISCRSKPDKIQLNVDRWLFLQIEDHSEYPIDSHFDPAFAFIEDTEKAVFVHCLFGSSRSTTMMAAYLMRKYWIPFSTAYAYVKKKHPKAQPTSLFESQLLEYEESLGLN